ncbi:MAG: ATP-binding protein [Burkholderiales bacterium]|nr:ATP-binding protein [Burkholderiales bacterium]
MRYIDRELARTLLRAARAFPAVVLTGPRRAGKTTLLRRLFPAASYRLLEDPALVAAARADPRGFLDTLTLPVILDEIQHVPELMNFIRARIDMAARRSGQWLLTGSQDFALMRGVTESMAGRAAVLQLLPLSIAESAKVTPFRGGYPEVLARPRDADLWFPSYVQTYLERDVRQVSQVRDLATFRRFLALLASRTGQLLNKTDLAAPLGISVPTVGEWLGILETTGQVIAVPPYFENFGKRLVKSPKLYFTDSGLACHLLGLETPRALAQSPFAGPVFEGFVAAEIVKHQINSGRRRELYFFRDERGLEVDFVVPAGERRLVLVEAKASRTVYPEAARSMLALARGIRRQPVECVVVHAAANHSRASTALADGARAMAVGGLLESLHRKR